MRRSIAVVAVVLAFLALASGAIALAHVIETSPIATTFKPSAAYYYLTAGPNAGMVGLTLSQPDNTTASGGKYLAASMSLPLTNNTYVFVYEPLELVIANSSGAYVYFPNVFVPSTNYIGYMWVEIVSTSGTVEANITVVSNGAAVQPTTGVDLPAGTYYIDIGYAPKLPVPVATPTASSETITLYIGVAEPTSSVSTTVLS